MRKEILDNENPIEAKIEKALKNKVRYTTHGLSFVATEDFPDSYIVDNELSEEEENRLLASAIREKEPG